MEIFCIRYGEIEIVIVVLFLWRDFMSIVIYIKENI